MIVPPFARGNAERSRVKAHNPACINAKKGAIVRIKECRPVSKTKNFVITEVLGHDIQYLAREELLQQAKMPEKEEEE